MRKHIRPATLALVALAMILTAGGCGLMHTAPAIQRESMDDLTNAPLFAYQPHVQTRWASPENPLGLPGAGGAAREGRKGRAFVRLPAGESLALAHAEGASGVVRRIWMTIDNRSPQVLRGLRLRCSWDGASQPAVDAPLGDFFGHAQGRMVTFENACFSSPEGRSFNCFIPMPFRRAMHIELVNQSPEDVAMLFYDVDYTLGDAVGENDLYFHALFREENPTTMKRDFEILPETQGAGRVLGACLGVQADTAQYFKSWWGEGEVKLYLDGDTTHPTLCGTGTEDYIGTAWSLWPFANRTQGCPLADMEQFQFTFYRFHTIDPIFFHRSVRMTIQQIGCWDPASREQMHEAGRTIYHAGPGWEPVDLSPGSGITDYGIFERADHWSACVYYYLNRP